MSTHHHDQPRDETPDDAPATPAVLEKKRRRRNERNSAMYDDEVFELLQAVDLWRRKSHRSFPAWSEVIQILKSLGWRKVAEPSALPVEPLEPVSPKPQ